MSQQEALTLQTHNQASQRKRVSVVRHAGKLCVCVSGVYADKIGIEAAEMLLRNIRHNGCVDEFLQDQVRPRHVLEQS